jgi:hypothetical protein
MFKTIPFAEMRGAVVREHLHAMLAVKATMIVADKGSSSASDDDLAGSFGNLIERPNAELIALIRSNVRNAAAAAALVFMHSAYENAIFDLVKQLVRYDPDAWYCRIDKKPVEFGQFRVSSVSEVRELLFAKWLREAERCPLPKKVNLILNALGWPETKGVIEGFEFRMDELEAIDRLRHSVTHHPNFAAPMHDVSPKLRFLHCTFLLLERLAELKYPGA